MRLANTAMNSRWDPTIRSHFVHVFSFCKTVLRSISLFSDPLFTRENPFKSSVRLEKTHYHPSRTHSLSKTEKRTVCFDLNGALKRWWVISHAFYTLLLLCRLWVQYVLTSHPAPAQPLWLKRARSCLGPKSASLGSQMISLDLQSRGRLPLTVNPLPAAAQPHTTWRASHIKSNQERPQFLRRGETGRNCRIWPSVFYFTTFRLDHNCLRAQS